LRGRSAPTSTQRSCVLYPFKLADITFGISASRLEGPETNATRYLSCAYVTTVTLLKPIRVKQWARSHNFRQHIEARTIMTSSIPKDVHTGPEDGWHGKINDESDNPFKPEKGRYHLFIGLFCPFAHRANIVRHMKGLQDFIDISVVKPFPKDDDGTPGWPGWRFPRDDSEYPAATVDRMFGSEFLHEVYFRADKDYKGKYSVPLLWDKKLNTIVNNVRAIYVTWLLFILICCCQESLELLRDLQTAFNEALPEDKAQLTLYPSHLRSEIDKLSSWIQDNVNKGVYKAGFAKDQETYEENIPPVFGSLNKLEQLAHRNGGPYMLGKQMTEVDILVFCTLIRFDPIYHQHFKCNLGMIRREYPVLHNWLKGMYWKHPEFRDTTNFKHIKENVSRGESLPARACASMTDIADSTPRVITMSTQGRSHRWVLGRILRRITSRIGSKLSQAALTCPLSGSLRKHSISCNQGLICSYRGTPLEAFANICRVFVVESGKFLVELLVLLVDESNVPVIIASLTISPLL